MYFVELLQTNVLFFSESDVYPNATWPIPTATQDDRSALPTRYVPDPALFVTPEKPSSRPGQRSHLITQHEPSTIHEVSKQKAIALWCEIMNVHAKTVICIPYP